jgi:hypothetical protein
MDDKAIRPAKFPPMTSEVMDRGSLLSDTAVVAKTAKERTN